MTSNKTDNNPVTTEIIRNAFNAIAEDMNASLIRSAFTPIIYEGKDCAVGLLDENGDVLGQSLGLPLFLGNLSLCVQIIAEMKGWDYYEEGDVVLLNDSYIAGTHLNDITVIMPIFSNGKRIGFATSRAHWLDVGAKDAGSPTDASEIYQEGMRWPPTKVYRRGEAQEDILNFMRANSRFGDALIGDLHAQIAAGRTGEKRMQGLIERFGYDTVKVARDDIFAQSAALERQAIAAIPDGEYTAEGSLDNDGISDDPVPVKLTVRIAGEKMEMDLTGSSPQTDGGVNCGFTQTVSALRVAFKLLVNPERPVDGGTFLALDVVAPEGSIFHAQEPAACSWYFSSLGLLIDMVVRALSPAMPERAAAAHYGDSMVTIFSGKDTRNDDAFYVAVEANCGGWGAWDSGDGQDCLINNVNGSFRDYPIEVFEHRYPMRIAKYGIRQDSGGQGEYRGGNGSYREYHLDGDTNLSLWFERSVTRPWGLSGGKAGLGPKVEIIAPDGSVRDDLLKASAMTLKAGSIVRVATGGGGGFGDPAQRSAERLEKDRANNFITQEQTKSADA